MVGYRDANGKSSANASRRGSCNTPFLQIGDDIAIDPVYLFLRHPGIAVAEADDVQRRAGKQLECGSGLHQPGEIACLTAILLHHAA